MTAYTPFFFESIEQISRRSAEVIIPMVIQLIRPKSAVDVGCGTGSWLATLRKNGVEDIVGVDGDYVERDKLQIPQDVFTVANLTKPLRFNRQFDLAVSMEVAEHLPCDCAATFIDSLTRLAPAVLFSAAIPFQGGAHHVNEQWPEYWEKLFSDRGYLAIDCIRRRVWQNQNVSHYYSQNVILYVKQDYMEKSRPLRSELEINGGPVLPLVHPLMWLSHSDPAKISPQLVIPLLPQIITNAFKRRIKRLLTGKTS